MSKSNDELLDIYDMEEARWVSEVEGNPMSEAQFTRLVDHYRTFGGRKHVYRRMMEMKAAGISKDEAIRTISQEVKTHLQSRGSLLGRPTVLPFSTKR